MIQQFLQTGLANYLLQHYKNPQPFPERFAQELSKSRYYPKPITQNELDVDMAVTKQMHHYILNVILSYQFNGKKIKSKLKLLEITMPRILQQQLKLQIILI